MEFLYADEALFQKEEQPKIKETNCTTTSTSCRGVGDDTDVDEDSIDDMDEVAAAIMLGLQGDHKKNDSHMGTEILDFTTNPPVLSPSFGEPTRMKTPPSLCRWNNTTLSSLPSTGRDDYSIQEVSSELDVSEVSSMLESPSLRLLGSLDDTTMGFASHPEEFLERPTNYDLLSTDATNQLGVKRRDGRINYCIGEPPPVTMKKMKFCHDNNYHNNNNYYLLNPEAQQTLMNEPIEHEYDALISGYHYGLEYVKSNKSSLVTNIAPIGAARKDVFDATEELEDTTNHIKTGEKLSTEPRVGLDSWQMQVLHRMIQKLPPKPQAMFKAYAARAIDRHLQGHEAKYYHLPGSIFEDLMIAQMDAELFLETYIAVRNEMHQLENVTVADILMKQNDCSPPPTSTTHHHHQSRHGYHHPNIVSPTQLAMGYAFSLGMKHAQTRSFLMGGSSSLDSILEEAKIKMNKVPPLERGRIWNEIVECVHVGHGSFFDGPSWTCQQVVYSDHYNS